MSGETVKTPASNNKGFLLGFGALASGLSVGLTALCCITPLALGAFGLGLAGLGARLEPYRPYLMAATFLFLGFAFYQAYRPESNVCEPGRLCSTPRGRRALRWTLWIILALAVLFSLSPYLASYYTYLTL